MVDPSTPSLMMFEALNARLLVGVIWVAGLLLLAFAFLAVYFSTRRMEIRMAVRYSVPRYVSKSTARALFIAGPAILLGSLAAVLSWHTPQAVRLSLIGVSAVVALVCTYWVWSTIHEGLHSRLEDFELWHSRAIASSRELRKVRGQKELFEATCKLIADQLRAAYVDIFWLEGGVYRLRATYGQQGRPAASIPTSSLLAEELRQRSRQPVLMLVDPRTGAPRSWADPADDRLGVEQEMLASAGAWIAAGVRLTREQGGLMLIGERLSDREYRQSQLSYVSTVLRFVTQQADAAETLEDIVAARMESVRKLALEEAAQIARASFAGPERPEMPGLDYSVGYSPGRGQGAFVYDMVALPNRSLGVVLAESMAPPLEAMVQLIQLQALLRSRFWAYGEDLRELMESTQRALLGTKATRPPIHVVCARFEPSSGTLHYVNAGHYAPMLVRRTGTGGEVLRLCPGGGALNDPASPPFQEGEMHLSAGDLMAIVTPSVVMAKDATGEIWGESRFIDTLLSWEHQPASEIAMLTIRASEEFSGPQGLTHDRAMLVLRVQRPPAGES